MLPSDDFVVNEQGALGMYKATAAIGLTTPWESADSPAVAQPIIFERVGDLAKRRRVVFRPGRVGPSEAAPSVRGQGRHRGPPIGRRVARVVA